MHAAVDLVAEGLRRQRRGPRATFSLQPDEGRWRMQTRVKKIGLQSLQSFIRNYLPKRLAADLKNLRSIKKADLEVATYYHLRTFLRQDRAWRVLARRYVPQTGYYVDLLIFRRNVPRLALELKWNREKISIKDRRSLRRAIDTLGVKKAYFITTCVRRAPYQPIKKTEIEKNRLFELVITPEFSDRERQNWQSTRLKLRNLAKRSRQDITDYRLESEYVLRIPPTLTNQEWKRRLRAFGNNMRALKSADLARACKGVDSVRVRI
ncbi:MAG: hypothetical protein RML56_03170 [Burkholderiales bacterium]|nr:hypothetical protein [Burkholderiales bacterium]